MVAPFHHGFMCSLCVSSWCEKKFNTAEYKYTYRSRDPSYEICLQQMDIGGFSSRICGALQIYLADITHRMWKYMFLNKKWEKRKKSNPLWHCSRCGGRARDIFSTQSTIYYVIYIYSISSYTRTHIIYCALSNFFFFCQNFHCVNHEHTARTPTYTSINNAEWSS